MSGYNHIVLVGNLTRDPEMRYTTSGVGVCRMRLAVTTAVRRQEGDRQEETLFIDVAVFGKMGEACSRFLVKGRSALVEGRLQERSWDTQEGERRSKVEVIARNVQFLGRGGGAPGEEASGSEAPRARQPRPQAAPNEPRRQPQPQQQPQDESEPPYEDYPPFEDDVPF
ncbi:MAG: single-stranded DNA-binding protein [Candidatus Schekmanbacteria bacterium]|nr:single-stranded DNA-binding protein [Candidatus Schekmanbacteria bacterium]